MSERDEFACLEQTCRARRPTVALVLGSGMGFVADRTRILSRVPFAAIPRLSAANVPGHRGAITLAEWSNRPVLLLEGRLHAYEGHSWDRVTLPTRTAASLGVKVILHTNAAGGINTALTPGSLMALTDHLDLTTRNWRSQSDRGASDPNRPTFYSPRLLDALDRVAQRIGVRLHHGVYACLLGPCYETPAEICALRSWGADAVGMSTAREVQVGVELGMECAAVSLITNKAAGLSETPLDHGEVLATAARESERLAAILDGFVLEMAAGNDG